MMVTKAFSCIFLEYDSMCAARPLPVPLYEGIGKLKDCFLFIE